MKKAINILILGVGGTAGMNFLSCINKNLYNVFGTEINEFRLECLKTYFRDFKFLKVQENTHPDYYKNLYDIIKQNNIQFIYAQPDSEVQALSKITEILKRVFNVETFLPSKKTLLICRDKYKTSTLLGNFAPKHILFDLKNKNLHKDFLNLRRQVKSKKLWIRATIGAGSKAALPVFSFEQALNWYNYCKDRDDKLKVTSDFMISEYLPGREIAWQGIFNEGELITSFSRERVDYLFGSQMPSGQSSTPSVSKYYNSKKMNVHIFSFINRIDKKPHGIFGIDMKENEKGELKVTEINAGRFYTTSLFPKALGLNLPSIYLSQIFNKNTTLNTKLNIDDTRDFYQIRSIDFEPIIYSKREK